MRTEITDEGGNIIGYSYSGKWNFDGDMYSISADRNYNPSKPVLTLYAAWVPDLVCEFYSVGEDGTLTLIETKEINPVESTEITLPAYDAENGAYEIGGYLYDLYYNEYCTGEKIDGTSITHTGIFSVETATVENPVMKIYCKPID